MADESGQELTQTIDPQRRQGDELVTSKQPEQAIERKDILLSLLNESHEESGTEKKSDQQIIEEQNQIIARLQQQVENLAESARIDEQTGLLNKNAFIADLYPALLKAFREGKKVALLSMDLQGLKVLNDTEGHEAGDALIAKYGEAIRVVTSERKRKTDGGYRVGGDEAIVLLYDTDEEGLKKAAEDYRSLFNREGIKTGIGGGIIDTTDWNSMQDSMKIIDERLYESKREAYETGENNIKLATAA